MAAVRAAEVSVVLRAQNEMASGLGAGETMLKRFGQTAQAALSGVAIGFATAATATAGYVVHASMAALRADEMQVALVALAKANNLNVATLDQYVSQIRKQGIEMGVAQNLVAEFVQGHLDLAKAQDLARVAQDAAVISGQNSTDTLAQLIWGIRTQQTEVLRSAGITIDAQSAYEAYAAANGKAVTALDNTTKQQIILNEVLKQGASVQGAYAAAMETPSKQLRSIPRLLNDISINIGSAFMPAFGGLITVAYELAKAVATTTTKGRGFSDAIQEIGRWVNQLLAPVRGAGQALVDFIRGLSGDQAAQFLDTLRQFAPVLAPLAGMLAALGGGEIKGLLGPFGNLLPTINPVVGALIGLVATSKDAQAALSQIFSILGPMMGQVLAALQPALQAISVAIRDVMATAAPVIVQVVSMLASAFSSLIIAIAPILPPIINLVGTLANALVPVIGAVLNAVQPLIPILVQLVSVFVAALQPVIPVIARLLQTLGPIIAQLVTILAPFIAQLAMIAGQVLVQLIRAFEPLLPIIGQFLVQLGQILVPILRALQPLFGVIVQVVMALAPVFVQLVQAILPIIPPLLQLVMALLPLLIPLIQLVAQVLTALAPIITQVLVFLIQNVVIPSINFLVMAIRGIIAAITWVAENIGPIIGQVVNWFSNLHQNVTNIISAITNWVTEKWNGLKDNLIAAAGWIRDQVVGAFNGLKDGIGRVMQGVKDAVKWPFLQVAGLLKSFFWALKGLPIIGGVFGPAYNFMEWAEGFIRGLAGGGIIDVGVRAVGRGIVTDRPMAVVGEGSNVWPEVVVPTDPLHRDNALKLMRFATDKMGLVAMQAGGSLGSWWYGTYPLTQGPGGGYSHAKLNAWDYSMPNGTTIVAGVPGSSQPFNNPGGYGNAIQFAMDQGGYVVLGHLMDANRHAGRSAIGQWIANSDNSGYSTGPHLHFEVRGSPLQPTQGGNPFRGIVKAAIDGFLKQFGNDMVGQMIKGFVGSGTDLLLNAVGFDQGGSWPPGVVGINRSAWTEQVTPQDRVDRQIGLLLEIREELRQQTRMAGGVNAAAAQRRMG